MAPFIVLVGAVGLLVPRLAPWAAAGLRRRRRPAGGYEGVPARP